LTRHARAVPAATIRPLSHRSTWTLSASRRSGAHRLGVGLVAAAKTAAAGTGVAHLYADFPHFREQGEQVAGPAISTGLSCAASVDEAVLKGICECVERDAFMITWMNRLPVPRVKIESHPQLRQLYEERLRRDGLHYVLLRTTTDIPIPSFLCLLIDERRSPPMICAGGATSLDPVHAAQKAMTEAVQTREWAKFLGGRQ